VTTGWPSWPSVSMNLQSSSVDREFSAPRPPGGYIVLFFLSTFFNTFLPEVLIPGQIHRQKERESRGLNPPTDPQRRKRLSNRPSKRPFPALSVVFSAGVVFSGGSHFQCWESFSVVRVVSSGGSRFQWWESLRPRKKRRIGRELNVTSTRKGGEQRQAYYNSRLTSSCSQYPRLIMGLKSHTKRALW
jgi:hypothetical protein